LDPWEFSVEDLEEEEVDLEEEEGVRAGAKLVSWSGRLGVEFCVVCTPVGGWYRYSIGPPAFFAIF
jgi:hypothetical protein